MKQISVFLLCLMLFSCEYFKVKKISSKDYLEEEMQTINWNDVDEYPAFSICDSSATKQERKQCFETVLTSHITNYLQNETIIVSHDIEDTLKLKLQISEKGVVSLLDVEVDSILKQEIPNIKTILVKSLDSMPKIFPALKRGQQVKTEFKLPIIVQVN